KDTSEFASCIQVIDPTEITFQSFAATGFDDGVLLEWQTGMEVNNLGFNIYREQDGKRDLVNQNLIAGSALTAGANITLAAGKHYSWFDPVSDDQQNALYWLEDIDTGGYASLYGPFRVQPATGKGQESKNNSRKDLSKSPPSPSLNELNQSDNQPS